eukprot:11636791-Alexandrium_andersonii.AAC.1
MAARVRARLRDRDSNLQAKVFIAQRPATKKMALVNPEIGKPNVVRRASSGGAESPGGRLWVHCEQEQPSAGN